MTETWRPVVGHEGKYEVSDLGRVRSTTHVIHDARGHTRTWRGRVLKLTVDGSGYFGCSLHQPGGQHTYRVHVLVAAAFIGPRPSGHEVAHGDGNPFNNVVTNLRYATPSENQLDCRLHGTDRQGEKHPLAKLTAEKVREARRLLAAGWYQKDVAAHLGCARTTIAALAQGRTWGSVA